MTTIGYRVAGRVQGVGYRAYAVRLARQCGVVGSVRNEADGSVRVEASGSQSALLSFAAGLRMGPPGARVETIEATVLDEGAGLSKSNFAVED